MDENGNATAATVIVTDTIPEGTECVADGGANYDDTAKTLTWTIDNAAANATRRSFLPGEGDRSGGEGRRKQHDC